MPRLSELAIGREARVVELHTEGAFGQRLMALGFMPGSPIRVAGVAPMGDPLKLEVAGRVLSLRRAEAALIEVSTEQ